MASAKYYGHPANTKYTGVFEINETNDVVGNKSVLSWSFKLFRNDSYNSSYSRQYGNRVVIAFDNNTIFDSTDVGTVKAPNGEANAYVLASGTTTIDHNADGTRSLNFTATYTNSESDAISPLTVSGTHALNTIPRASSITVPAFTMGSAGTISIHRASTAFTHTLEYWFGNEKGTIATGAGTSASWTPAKTLGSQIRNAISGTGTITCITYSGGTEIGRSTANFTLSVSDDMVPSFLSLTASRIDGDVPSAWGIYVAGKSKAMLTINDAAGNNGSTISAYSISGGKFSSSDPSFTTGFLDAGDIIFTAKVRDSRGRWSAEKTVTISVVEYFKPKFTAFGTYRCLEDGTKSDEGTYFRAYAEFAYSDCAGKNTVTCTVKYKRSTATYWTTAGTITSGVAGIFGGANIALEGSYDVQYILDDALESPVIYESFVSSTYYTMHFKKGGKGVAIGKTAEEDNLFDVALPSKFREGLTVHGEDEVEHDVAAELTVLNNNLITVKDYEVTTVDNPYVSPLSSASSIPLVQEIQAFGDVIGFVILSDHTDILSLSFVTEGSLLFVASNRPNTYTVRVTFKRQI